MRDARELPTGTVTLLFTDIEGSTLLLAALGDRYVDELNAHRTIVRRAVAANDGHEVDTQGDAFFVAFPTADGAVAAAVTVQRELLTTGSPVRVRIGVHTGAPSRNEEGYVGLALHQGARICASGHGGQVVLSDTTRALVTRLPDGVTVRALGKHLLKDLALPLPLSDLVVDGLPDRFPPLRSIDAHPTNLPTAVGDLVGREDDLEAAAAMITDAGRLVTLTGPGGIGKTALATHLATRQRLHFVDGVYVVWLAAIGTAAQVPEEIARTLGLRERAGVSAENVLHDFLRNRTMLLYLDNFEHVVEAAALVHRLLESSEGLRVVVTSRLPLRLRGEVELRIAPLETGASVQTSAAHSPAVELFVSRARQVLPDFDPDAATRVVVAEICRRLDGLPLAIELAAARSRLLSPAAMLERLDRPLEIAGGRSRNADDRHQTLRATIAWSYGLLDPALQDAFTRLAVFAGPFSLEAAEEVAEVGLDDLADLLDHSLVRSADGDADAGRLGMLVTIHAYAKELLEASEDAAAVHDRHAAWAARLAAHGGPALLDAEHEDYLGRFDAEQEEFRAALDWLLASGQAEAARILAADLGVFWDTRGQWTEGRARLEATLAASATADRDRARALFMLGRMAIQQHDVDRAKSAFAEALPLLTRDGTARDVVLCRSHIAMTADDSGEAEQAVLDLARESGDPWAIGVALNNLADSLKTIDPRQADRLLTECLSLRRALGEKRTLAITLGNIGDVQATLGNPSAAEAAYRESLTCALDIGFEMMIADARRGLAGLAVAAGRAEEARALATDARERAERLGDSALVAQIDALLEHAERESSA